MSRGSFGRTVARAAASGGSKNYRARPPMLWYVLMAVIVVGGLFLVGYSRNERLHPVAAASAHPTASDNWHAALAIDICGTIRPNLAANTNFTTAGIRTFGDGVIDVDPGAVSNSSAFTGKHDTLATFVSTYGRGFALTPTSLTLPGRAATATPSTQTTTVSPSSSTSSTSSSSSTSSTAATGTTSASNKTATKAVSTATTKGSGAASTGSAASTSSTTAAATSTTAAAVGGPTYRNGQSCPTTSKTPGKASLVAKVWTSPTSIPHLVRTNIGAIKILNGQMITLAFVPAGTSIPAPPSRSTLLQDLGGSTASSGK